jgi:hypothetical protein
MPMTSSQEASIMPLKERDFDEVWNSLPKGAYIVNGKKMIK